MPKSVLYASHTPEYKGSAVSLFQLMTGLDRERYRPVAAFSKPGPMVERLGSHGIPAYVLDRRGLLGICLVRQAMRLIRDEDIGLVHLNSAMPFLKYVGIAAKLMHVPVVWHIREDPEGKRVRSLGPWIRRLSDRIFVVSSDLYDHFAPTGKAVKIYNGVDVERFRPGMGGGAFRERLGIPGDAFVFGMVGTIEPRKGNAEFIEAAESLAGSDGGAYYLIVGTGTEENLSGLKAVITSKPNLSGRVVLAGRVEDVPSVMDSIDVLVMPSKWEGFPRALIEAMACGRPSIATEVGEVSHILDNGVDGFVVRPDDAEGLKGAMLNCLNNRDKLDGIGAAARDKARKQFTSQRHAENVQGRYDDVLLSRGKVR